MALETFLSKLKTAISPKPTSNSTSKPNRPSSSSSSSSINKNNIIIEVLSFEIAGLMCKLLNLWQNLSDASIVRLRNESISLEGVRKIVSNDESFLLGLACAELAESLRHVAKSVSRLSQRCTNHSLRCFERMFKEFADLGRDLNGWAMGSKETEAKNKKLERYVSITATLYKEMEELSAIENALKKSSLHPTVSTEYDYNKEQRVKELHQKLQWQKQQVKYLKDRSLWNKSFDVVVLMLARSIFSTLARIKSIFGIGHVGLPSSLPRSLSSSSSSSSALVHPSFDQTQTNVVPNMVSEQTCHTIRLTKNGIFFFETGLKLLKPPETTLGASALALHYANLIIVIEKMVKQPQLVGLDARDDLYSMLPSSIRSSLRSRLRGVGFTATDSVLAGDWKAALGRIMGWLLPLAHNMIKWHSERSFENQNLVANGISDHHHNVMLLQTLFYANREKTEAAITELLVGLNYIWRFEREMTAKALFNLQNPPK